MTCQCSGIVVRQVELMKIAITIGIVLSWFLQSLNSKYELIGVYLFPFEISVAVFIYTCSINESNVLPCANIFYYIFLPMYFYSVQPDTAQMIGGYKVLPSSSSCRRKFHINQNIYCTGQSTVKHVYNEVLGTSKFTSL